MFTRPTTGVEKLLDDRNDTDTSRCRLSREHSRREVGDTVRKVSDNPMHKAFLSGREKAEFTSHANAIDTHNPNFRRI
jgi:hypothetical protein